MIRWQVLLAILMTASTAWGQTLDICPGGNIPPIPDVVFDVPASDVLPYEPRLTAEADPQVISIDLENVLPAYMEFVPNWTDWRVEIIPLNADSTLMDLATAQQVTSFDVVGLRLINLSSLYYEIRTTVTLDPDTTRYKNLTFPYARMACLIDRTHGFVNTPNTDPRLDDFLEQVSIKYLRGGDGSSLVRPAPRLPRELRNWNNNDVLGFEDAMVQTEVEAYNQDPDGFTAVADLYKLTEVPAGEAWNGDLNSVPLIWEDSIPQDGGFYSPAGSMKFERGPPERTGPAQVREEMESHLRVQSGERAGNPVNDAERLIYIVGDAINGTGLASGQGIPSIFDQFPPNSTTVGAGWPLELPSFSIGSYAMADSSVTIDLAQATPTGVPASSRIVMLGEAVPNPFNPSTTISWTLPSAQHAKLEIFDAKGRLVSVLVDGELPEGPGSIQWDGTDATGARVSSGVYFYRLKTADFEDTKRMVLLK